MRFCGGVCFNTRRIPNETQLKQNAPATSKHAVLQLNSLATIHFFQQSCSSQHKHTQHAFIYLCVRFFSHDVIFALRFSYCFHSFDSTLLWFWFNEFCPSEKFVVRIFAEICSGRDRAENQNDDHVHHLERLVCRAMVLLIQVHQSVWVPLIWMNVRHHHQALKIGTCTCPNKYTSLIHAFTSYLSSWNDSKIQQNGN